MTDALLPLGVFLAGYLIGAIPFGYLIARRHGVDLFKQGSGNIGATNVGRLLGRRLGTVVFLLDFAKGAGPTLIGSALGGPAYLGVIAGLAALLGHLFPVYLGFRGGKGVATGAGVVAVLLPVPTLVAMLAWATVLSTTRYMSLASLTAAAVLCLARLLTVPNPFGETERILTGFSLVTAALVLLRHRGNVRRLLGGTENRLEDSRTMTTLSKVLHVLTVGLWFGSAVFFSLVVAPTLFGRFETLAVEPPELHKWWFQSKYDLDKPALADFHTEQGSRAAGAAISPMFDWYFVLQGVCGVVAMATALRWSMADPAAKVHRWRSGLLIAAVATVVIGWPLERYVHVLRFERNEKVDIYLRAAADGEASPDVVADAGQQAKAARGLFGMVHGLSFLLNFVTLALVTAALALAALLPATQPKAVALAPPAPVEQPAQIA